MCSIFLRFIVTLPGTVKSKDWNSVLADNVGIWAGAATNEDIVFDKLGDEVVLGFSHRFGHRIALVQALELLLQPLHRFAFVFVWELII